MYVCPYVGTRQGPDCRANGAHADRAMETEGTEEDVIEREGACIIRPPDRFPGGGRGGEGLRGAEAMMHAMQAAQH